MVWCGVVWRGVVWCVVWCVVVVVVVVVTRWCAVVWWGFDTGPPKVGAGSLRFSGFSLFFDIFCGFPAAFPTPLPALF